jgi:hypothetical protein
VRAEARLQANLRRIAPEHHGDPDPSRLRDGVQALGLDGPSLEGRVVRKVASSRDGLMDEIIRSIDASSACDPQD